MNIELHSKSGGAHSKSMTNNIIDRGPGLAIDVLSLINVPAPTSESTKVLLTDREEHGVKLARALTLYDLPSF